ncbi:MAG: permease [Thermotogae bacterium]|nr:permease [Thermotogota bacterium]
MRYLYIVTVIAIVFSFIADWKKTLKAFKIAIKRFINILPAFLIMLILVSIVLFLVPDKVISRYIGSDNKLISTVLASLFGSITLMPGFIAFPLCGILLKKGVSYMVLSAFTTTLMMVGVLTYPVEKEYFGIKVTIIRNTISFLIAIVIAITTGFFFGEVF